MSIWSKTYLSHFVFESANDNKGALVIDKNKVFETQSVTTLEAGKSLVIATTAGQKLSFKNSAGDKDLSQLLKIKGNSISQTTFALLGKEDARIDISSYKSLNLGSDNKAKISTGGEDGAIYLNFTNATLNYVTFKDNYAEVEDNRAGSGWTRASVMHLKGSFVTVDNTIFENNEAKAGDGTVLEGGLIFLESGKILEGYPGTLVIRNSNFKNNIGTAEYRAEGGVIYAIEKAQLLLDTVVFEGNNLSAAPGKAAALKGGVLYMHSSDAKIVNSIFKNNTLDSSNGSATGGAIYTNGTGNNKLEIVDTAFLGNSVSKQNSGGAIEVAGGSLIINSTNGNKTVFSGNLSNNLANSINFSNTSNVQITGAGTLDMLDPISMENWSGAVVNKIDSGSWKLGGDNKLESLSAKEGVIYLYSNGEVDNPNINDTVAKVAAGWISTEDSMILGAQDKKFELVAMGGNKLSSNFENLTLKAHAEGSNGETKLTFNTTDANIITAQNEKPNTAGMTADTSVMLWTFSGPVKVDGAAGEKVVINVDKAPGEVGDILHLVNSTNALGLNPNADQFKLVYNGVDLAQEQDGSRMQGLMALNVDDKNIYITSLKDLVRGVAHWTNEEGTSTWNTADTNWNVRDLGDTKQIDKKFAPTDEVVFGTLGKDQVINVTANGSNYPVTGMTVNADTTTNYTFNGDGVNLLPGTVLTKENDGKLTINNTINANETLLNGGVITVGETAANSTATLGGNLIAKAGTSVTGHGTITGKATIESGAALSSHGDINELKFGDLILGAGSTLLLDVKENGESDKIFAKKDLTIAENTKSTGNIVVEENVTLDVNAEDGEWRADQSYDIMIADGIITGNFKTINTNLAFLTPTSGIKAGSDNKIMELKLARNEVKMPSLAFTYNQKSVAKNIDGMPLDSAVAGAITGLKATDVPAAFDNLSGEIYASTESALFQNAGRLQYGVNQRFLDTSRSLWVDGLGYTGEIKGDGNAAKVDTSGYGLMMGYDHQVAENWMLGAAIGYENSKIKINDTARRSQNRVKSTHFVVYGLAELAGMDFKASAAYSKLRFNSDRTIWVPGLVGNAKANYRGHQVQLFLEGAKTFGITEDYAVTPYANVTYTNIKANAFTETGSKAALTAAAQSNDRTAIRVGVSNAWALDTADNYALRVDLGMKYMIGSKTIDKDLRFVGNATSFDVRAASINRTSAVIGLGFNAEHNDMSFDVGYQGEFNNRVKDHALGMNFKWNL